MALASWRAVVVTLVAFAAYRVAPPRWRGAVLLAASAAFYAFAGARDALVMAGLVAFAWLAGRAIAARPTRARLAAGVGGVLAVLAVFKYSAMGAQTVNAVLHACGSGASVHVPRLPLPLGISFVSFGLVHFLVETYRGATVPGAGRFALYALFFPTVTLGPIKRQSEFVRDLDAVTAEAAPLPGAEDLREGLLRIVRGLVRKFVVADTVALLVPYLSDPASHRATLLVGVAAYALRIYFDFAGYSDMAIGTARLFGFRIMENFDRPYLQRNISQFWKHWHMSLTRFITENVFIPLGGSRAVWWRVALNTMVAMGLSGLWHGAGWNFVAWGLYHGAGLVVLRWWAKGVAALRARFPRFDRVAASRGGSLAAGWAAWALTLCFVWLGWVLFALPLRGAAGVYCRLLGLPPGTLGGLLKAIGG